MGEHKGHGVKGPRHDNDIDDLGVNQASQQQSGTMQSGRQPGNMQSAKQQDSQQSGQPQANQQSSKQQQGSQQSGQQSGSQQSGGQHASGGTPALDDLGSRQGESAKDASQAWSQGNSTDKQRGKQ